MENSGLSIPQAPPASATTRAIGNVAGKIRVNARDGDAHASEQSKA
jgi:hypothetical protein